MAFNICFFFFKFLNASKYSLLQNVCFVQTILLLYNCPLIFHPTTFLFQYLYTNNITWICNCRKHSTFNSTKTDHSSGTRLHRILQGLVTFNTNTRRKKGHGVMRAEHYLRQYWHTRSENTGKRRRHYHVKKNRYSIVGYRFLRGHYAPDFGPTHSSGTNGPTVGYRGAP